MSRLYDLGIYFANTSAILVCVILKVPQIVSLVKVKSATGLSLPSILLELIAFTIGLCYSVSGGYPLSSYLEYPLLVFQCLLLLALVLYYGKQMSIIWLGAFGIYLSIAYALSVGLFPSVVLTTLMTSGIPIAASSKLAQLRSMQASQNSESVSILTWCMGSYVCIARIFTNIDRGLDIPLMINYIVSFVLNMAVVGLALKLRRKPSLKKA